tara:strand:+ start:4076 stop:4459 length:384 start_codon:yes stop_codon:yes gene_type:complete
MRECIKCNEVKPDESFQIRKKNGLHRYECRPCVSEWQKEYRKNNKELIRLQAAARTYNITIEAAYELYSIKECGICNRDILNNKSKCIDHCHTTGKVRGILCTQCNTGLGMFKDNKEFLTNAIKWIK